MRVIPFVCALAISTLGAYGPARAETFIVKDGQPHAEIVIADKPARMTKLAVRELQTYIRKISGAELPVTNAPGGTPVQIYLGKSAFTDKLALDTSGLKYGAFRMASGTNWFALLGPDKDFIPIEPWMHERKDKDRVLQEWDKITGDKFATPYSHQYRRYSAQLDYWEDDDAGTMNAVHEFLRSLGVRWYFPGEVGEVVPKLKSIALPAVNKTVKPDFPLRYLQWVYKHIGLPEDDLWWSLRLDGSGSLELLGLTQSCHGMKFVTTRDEMKKDHPEYYALWNGRRATDHRECGAPCLSSEGVFKAHLKYARAVFDHYHEPLISLDVCDGYARLCQCDLCKGKDTPERGWRGLLSDYVWGYVDRVARELQKSHPDRQVSGIVYGSHVLPPEKIDKLNPNLSLLINQTRSSFIDPAEREKAVALRKAWLAKLTSGELFIFEHYRASEGVPDYAPRLIAEDLRSLKGISKGDTIELFHNKDPNHKPWHAMAAMHLNLYVTSRFWWDADQDLDSLLEEYYTLFYGPARAQMKAFITYCEANWPLIKTKVEVIDKTLELFAAARAAAGDGIYGQRVQIMADFLEPLKARRTKLGEGRKDVPRAVAVQRKSTDLVLDGSLDEAFWKDAREYPLKDIVTGAPPARPAAFKVAWSDTFLVFGIRCDEPDMQNISQSVTKHDDPSIWEEDNIEILLETPAHESYYQIAVNLGGVIVDIDRKGKNTLWNSESEVAVHKADKYWCMEIKIPTADANEAGLDKLKQVSGAKPTATDPWYFNLYRHRVRTAQAEGTAAVPKGDKSRGRQIEGSAFSPTGGKLHNPMKFGELVAE